MQALVTGTRDVHSCINDVILGKENVKYRVNIDDGGEELGKLIVRLWH